MKSFLAGEAEIRLGLNEDLLVGAEEKRRGLGGVALDDCNFHENAQLEQFDKERMISIVAPDGEVGEVSHSHTLIGERARHLQG